MGQRKLTDAELRVLQATLIGIDLANVLREAGGSVLRVSREAIDQMVINGTTDGKPYVKPQPEIGEGYRVATDADRDRPDVEFWSNTTERWESRGVPNRNLMSSFHCRVPIDRIPTDDDARERPLVMVRDFDSQSWQRANLLMVGSMDMLHRFVALMGERPNCWRQCRFPYPGE